MLRGCEWKVRCRRLPSSLLPLLRTAALLLGVITVTATLLPALRLKAWWVRIWDFPRLQLALLGAVALALWILAGEWLNGWRIAFVAVVALALLRQLTFIWRYTRLAPREVQPSRRNEPERRLSLVISNVLQDNREAGKVIATVRDADADVIFCVETDDWWRDRLDVLRSTHPHVVQQPRGNTYGMLLYSRLPLEDTAIDFLVQDDVPSIQAVVRLRNGERVWLNCVHPRPPAPGESDDSLPRDAELLIVGKRVCDASMAVVVCGDLNDVAWSHTTRLFQRLSGLLDPRKGRGFYSTFHARYPGLRYPLDHVFHSSDFRLVTLRKLDYVGSDHFPVHIILSHEPSAETEQEEPDSDASDEREAAETVADSEAGAGR